MESKTSLEKGVEQLLRTEVGRRKLLRAGLSTLVGGWASHVLKKQEILFQPLARPTETFLQVSTIRYEAVEVEAAVHRFWNSKTFDQAAIYQLPFRPDVLLHGRAYLDAVTMESKARESKVKAEYNPEQRRLHRLIAYPAIVAAHLVPYAGDGDELTGYQDTLGAIYTEGVSKSRESEVAYSDIRDIVAQNCLTSLISSRDSWRNFVIPDEIIKLMRSVVTTFLHEKDGARDMHAAATAYQFLLAYRIALGDRSGSQQLELISQIREDVQSQQSGRGAWLRALDSLYKSLTTFDLQMPQLTEMLTGIMHFPPGHPWADVTNLFIAMRLYTNADRYVRTYQDSSTTHGVVREQFVRSNTFLAQNGVDQEMWQTNVEPYLSRSGIVLESDHLAAVRNLFAHEHITCPPGASDTLWHRNRAPMRRFSEPSMTDAVLGVSLADASTDQLVKLYQEVENNPSKLATEGNRIHELTLRHLRRTLPSGEVRDLMKSTEALAFDTSHSALVVGAANDNPMWYIEETMKAVGASRGASSGRQRRSSSQEDILKHQMSQYAAPGSALTELSEIIEFVYDPDVIVKNGKRWLSEIASTNGPGFLSSLLDKFAIAIDVNTGEYVTGEDGDQAEELADLKFGEAPIYIVERNRKVGSWK